MGKSIKVGAILFLACMAVTACISAPQENSAFLPTIIPIPSQTPPPVSPTAMPTNVPRTATTDPLFAGIPTRDLLGTAMANSFSTSMASVYEPAKNASKANLASILGVDVNQITVTNTESITWPDTCLGVTQPGMTCDPFMVPGFVITLSVNGQQFVYHTDFNGDRIYLIGQQ
jgi:hypothetical protein